MANCAIVLTTSDIAASSKVILLRSRLCCDWNWCQRLYWNNYVKFRCRSPLDTTSTFCPHWSDSFHPFLQMSLFN